jgi:hypothetical protein
MRHVWLMLLGLAGCSGGGSGGRVEFVPEPALVLPAVTVVPGRVATVAGQLELRNGTSEARRLEVRVTPDDGALSVSVEGSPSIEPGATRRVEVRASLSAPGARRWSLEIAGAVAVITAEANQAGACALRPRWRQPEQNTFVREVSFENVGAATCFVQNVFVDGSDSLRVVDRPALVRPLPSGARLPVEIEGTPGVGDAVLVLEVFNGVTQRIPLTRACLPEVSPGSHSFGSVRVGCSAPVQSVTVRSTCPGPVTVTFEMVVGEDFSIVGPTRLAFEPGASKQVAVKFTPRPGAWSVSDGLAVRLDGVESDPVVLSLDGRSEPSGRNTDTFVNEPPLQADWLIVADTGDTLRSTMDSLRRPPRQARWPEVDIHFALTTWGSDGTLLPITGTSRVVTSRAPTLDSLIDAWPSAQPRVPGASCLETALLALSEAKRSGVNAEFRRAGVRLDVICVSDRPDATTRSRTDLVASLRQAGGPRVTVSSWGANTGILAEVVEATNGLSLELSHSAYAGGTTGFWRRKEFFLTGFPGVGQLLVIWNAVITPEVDANGRRVWRYEPTSNSVVFEDYPFGTIEIRYRPSCP